MENICRKLLFPLPQSASSTQKTKTSKVHTDTLIASILDMLTSISHNLSRGQSSLSPLSTTCPSFIIFGVRRAITTDPFTLPMTPCSIISEQQTKRCVCWACFSQKGTCLVSCLIAIEWCALHAITCRPQYFGCEMGSQNLQKMFLYFGYVTPSMSLLCKYFHKKA